jgi:uncharacterized protein with FMN-binding domain
MKRFLLALFGTVGGLVALLSFKTQSPVATAGPLPEQALGNSTTTAPAGSSTSSTSSADPPASTSPKSASTSATPTTTTRQIAGSAITTRYGVVQVKVTVSGSKITNVGFVQLTAFDSQSEQINSYAAPQLLQETLSAQSSNIDSVSGATYTSDGYRQSLQSALDQAGIR